MKRTNLYRWCIALLAGLLLVVALAWLAAGAIHRRSIEARLARLDPLIRRQAEWTGLSRELIRAVVRAESGGDPRAVSHKQAIGLMQVRADAETDALRILRIPQGDLTEPDYNLRIGTTYLQRMHDRFGGDPYLALAAYHMGAARLQEILRDHPGLAGAELVRAYCNPTTRAYVLKIMTEVEAAQQ